MKINKFVKILLFIIIYSDFYYKKKKDYTIIQKVDDNNEIWENGAGSLLTDGGRNPETTQKTTMGRLLVCIMKR